MSDSLVTKVILSVVILLSLVFLGIVVYERTSLRAAIEQKKQELKSYKNEGLGYLSGEKFKLEKQLKYLQSADTDLSGLLFSKPVSKMAKEAGDPLKFKEELYKVQNKLKEEGSSINFQFPFWLGFDRYEHDIPSSADIPSRVKQLDIVKEIGNIALASKVPEISGIEFLEVKRILGDDNKEILYLEFPVKVVLKCKNDNLVNFLYKLSVSDIPFRIESFKIKVSEEEGEAQGDLTAEIVIVAAILPSDKI